MEYENSGVGLLVMMIIYSILHVLFLSTVNSSIRSSMGNVNM